MDAAVPAGQLVCLLGLGDAAADGEIDQLLMPLTPGAPMVDLRFGVAEGIVAVGVHRAEGAGAARLCPMPA